MERYPFAYDPSQPFVGQLSDWVSDVFYDLLPEAGFEVRDEQIYMAFQLERAYAEKKTILAEAGVGTGKTLVYLLYAAGYARYTRKPAVIACADESLIEQLVKPEGDVAKLARHLGLRIDARLGKSMDQYLCLNKLDKARTGPDGLAWQELYEELPDFVHSYETLQAFHPYGDRKHYPGLNDEQWSRVNWDSFQDCFACEQRHRCGQTLSRDHYRKSADLIICSHDFYMEHVWTYEARKREGQLPLLPEHSSVVFDEGHLLETAAQKALTYKLKHAVFEELVTRLLQGEIREKLAVLIDEAILQSEVLFEALAGHSEKVHGSDRKKIRQDDSLLREVSRFRSLLTEIEEELVFESELYTLNDYQLRIVEEHIEMIQKALGLFRHSDRLICWLDGEGEGATLTIMPKAVKEVLREHVFSQAMPLVFSSATLSVGGSFRYVADSLGMEAFLSFSTPSPYRYAEQMEVIAPRWQSGGSFEEKKETALRLLARTGGRALILFPAKEELARFKAELGSYPLAGAGTFYYEGDGEISHLISSFQREETSVLCAVSLWEGLDIPGPSLSHVMIWELPFPPQDPVYEAKRRQASAAPFEEVDLPYMLLRLRQGIGRLIRTGTDHGLVSLLSKTLWEKDEVRRSVEHILPEGVGLKAGENQDFVCG
ncbi:ATP-dependent DNA helicase [Paenibacillus aurantius]|uniref:ATP-dependent DNA helicase n=1 Tax=Paenibacillus aurantius TaxID=2918900 RepID=A0AA96LA95_9BACL|nr:ATP-dependent DNA helicase [Paenibacillus aurantius]WNQ09428.1 ATP-dependent DNA helicase [Paenibacillus aurantius]